MANLRKPNTSCTSPYTPSHLLHPKPSNEPPDFGIISGSIGLALCLGQSYKGHVDARHERERMQEMHEQKMHYLHEFHRQQLHAKDHRIAAMAAENRALEVERLAGMYSEKVRRDGGKGGEGEKERGEKEREVLRMMGAARQDEVRGGEEGGEGV